MYNQYICEKALTRTARKSFRKAGLHESFVARCYVWFMAGSKSPWVGNFVFYNGKFTMKDARRLDNILPHVLKSLKKTAKACGFKGEFKFDEFLAPARHQ
jgi:hypothetical protein